MFAEGKMLASFHWFIFLCVLHLSVQYNCWPVSQMRVGGFERLAYLRLNDNNGQSWDLSPGVSDSLFCTYLSCTYFCTRTCTYQFLSSQSTTPTHEADNYSVEEIDSESLSVGKIFNNSETLFFTISV